MKKLLASLWLCVLLVSCGGGGSDETQAGTPPPTGGLGAAAQLEQDLQGLSLADFYETSFGALSYRRPEAIVWNALTSVYPLEEVGLNDISDAYKRETYAMYEVVLGALRTYDRDALDAAEQLTLDFYEWYLQDFVDSRPFMYYNFATAYNFHGVHRNTERLFTNIHPLATRQDADDYITRLRAVGRKFDQLIEYLDLQSGAGIIEPQLSMDWALFGINRIADASATDVSYYAAFRDKINDIAGLSEGERQSLRDSALAATRDVVIPAYQALRGKLQTLRSRAPTSIGVSQYPLGDEYYAYVLRHRTTTDLTAAQIHQLGLEHMQRIKDEMRAIFDQLEYPDNESVAQLFDRVIQDGGIIPAADVKTTYEGIIAAAELRLDEAFDIFPTNDVIVAEDEFGGFYIGPSFDGTRPGAFYASTRFDEPYYAMPSLTYHEAIPGHHTQIAIAMDLDTGPSFRRAVRFTGFVEGWALYAERLAWELGWYADDPYGNLGRLQFEALRAARLVMDTGIHSMGWSFEQAVQYNIDNVGWSRSASEGAAARYSVVPAQATAYMIGLLHILDARQRAQDQLGAAFDLKEFHRVVLISGGVPLALLDGIIDNWIADKLANP
jgi:uncharacterized protein (DUF885 family)